MNLLNLPTDNFYKFITLFGLITFCYCSFIVGTRFVENRNTEHKEINNQIELNYKLDKLHSQEVLLKISLSKEIRSLDLDSFILVTDSLKSIKSVPPISTQVLKEFMLIFNNKTYIKNQLNSCKVKLEDSQWYANALIPSFLLLALFGLIISGIGFYNWFFKHQAPLNKKIAVEEAQTKTVYKRCQSCGNYLYRNTERPKNKDGSINFKYCRDCFTDGKFNDLGLTLEDLNKRKIKKLKIKNKLTTWLVTCDNKYLDRWRITNANKS